MFVTVLLPVVDVRPLVVGETRRDPLPHWPRPDRVYARQSPDHHRSNYIRGLGPVRPRLRGGTPPWLSESTYVDASRLVRLERKRNERMFDDASVTPLYRNLYTDGVVGRLEVCQRVVWSWWPLEWLVTGERRVVMATPTWLRGHLEDQRPLIQFGPEFARHLLAATTGPGSHQVPSWWVQSGTPAVIEEVTRADDPPEYGDAPATSALRHEWLRQAGVRASVWHLNQGVRDDDELRRLRIHVSRLHAEFVAIETIVGLCHDGLLDASYGPVERYLRRALDLLLRPARHGYAQAGLLAQVLASAQEPYADAYAALERLDGLGNPDLAAQAARLAGLLDEAPKDTGTVTVHIGELVMEKNETHISGGTFHGSVSTGSGDAHTYGGGADTQRLLADLTAAVEALAAALPAGQGAAVRDVARGVEREVQKPAAERDSTGLAGRLKSLLEMATGAGTAGAALAAAIAALRAALGF